MEERRSSIEKISFNLTEIFNQTVKDVTEMRQKEEEMGVPPAQNYYCPANRGGIQWIIKIILNKIHEFQIKGKAVIDQEQANQRHFRQFAFNPTPRNDRYGYVLKYQQEVAYDRPQNCQITSRRQYLKSVLSPEDFEKILQHEYVINRMQNTWAKNKMVKRTDEQISACIEAKKAKNKILSFYGLTGGQQRGPYMMKSLKQEPKTEDSKNEEKPQNFIKSEPVDEEQKTGTNFKVKDTVYESDDDQLAIVQIESDSGTRGTQQKESVPEEIIQDNDEELFYKPQDKLGIKDETVDVDHVPQINFLAKEEIDDETMKEYYQEMFSKIPIEVWEKIKTYFLFEKTLSKQDFQSIVIEALNLWDFDTSVPMSISGQYESNRVSYKLSKDPLDIITMQAPKGLHFLNSLKMKKNIQRQDQIRRCLVPVSNESCLNTLIRVIFAAKLVEYNLNYETACSNDLIFDNLLIESSIMGYQNVRVPGKYVYDTSKGEITIESYNQLCQEEFEHRLKALQYRQIEFSKEQQEEYLGFHKNFLFCKKGYNRRWIVAGDSSINHKLKRKLIMLKLGIDQFTLMYRCQAKVWGTYPNIMVLHDCMSATMFNYQYSNFLGKITSLKKDPFNPMMELDYFGQYHMQNNNYYYEKTIEKIVIRDYGDQDISALNFGTYIYSYEDEIEVEEIQDLVEDERFQCENLFDQDLPLYLFNNVVEHQLMYKTPKFYQHFEIFNAIDVNHLTWLVNFKSLQLGFFFQSYTREMQYGQEKLHENDISSVKFTCSVGSQQYSYKLGPGTLRKDYDLENESEYQKKRSKHMFHNPKRESITKEEDVIKDENSQDDQFNPDFEELLKKKKKKKKKSYKKSERERNSYDNAFEDLTKPKPKFYEQSAKFRSNRKYDFDCDIKCCHAFVLYERLHKYDNESPFVLTDFNFLHSHPLNLSISFPLTYTEVQKAQEIVDI